MSCGLLEELAGLQELQLKLTTTEEEKRIIKEQLQTAQVSRQETHKFVSVFLNKQEAAQVEIQQLKKEVDKVILWFYLFRV